MTTTQQQQQPQQQQQQPQEPDRPAAGGMASLDQVHREWLIAMAGSPNRAAEAIIVAAVLFAPELAAEHLQRIRPSMLRIEALHHAARIAGTTLNSGVHPWSDAVWLHTAATLPASQHASIDIWRRTIAAIGPFVRDVDIAWAADHLIERTRHHAP